MRVALLALACAGCGARSGLPELDACTCLDPWVKPFLDEHDILLLATEARATCYPRPGREDMPEWERARYRCLPALVGIDEQSGLPVEMYAWCSDLCPGNRYVGLRYRDVFEEECAATGGIADHEYAFGFFSGCRPPAAVPAGDWWD